jgi:glutathione S-transferase
VGRAGRGNAKEFGVLWRFDQPVEASQRARLSEPSSSASNVAKICSVPCSSSDASHILISFISQSKSILLSSLFIYLIMSSNNIGKLYYSPYSCGAASFIIAEIGKVQYQSEPVDIREHKTLESKEDFYKINPKGNVPTLITPDGLRLDEGSSVTQYIADKAGEASGLLPKSGNAHYEVLNWFNYVGTELHKGSYYFLFDPSYSSLHDKFKERLDKKLKFLDGELANKKYLVGTSPSIADIYLYIVLGWSAFLKLSLDPYPNVKKFHEGIHNLDVVKQSWAKMMAAQPKQ